LSGVGCLGCWGEVGCLAPLEIGATHLLSVGALSGVGCLSCWGEEGGLGFLLSPWRSLDVRERPPMRAELWGKSGLAITKRRAASAPSLVDGLQSKNRILIAQRSDRILQVQSRLEVFLCLSPHPKVRSR
jgi:hypothetical protein